MKKEIDHGKQHPGPGPLQAVPGLHPGPRVVPGAPGAHRGLYRGERRGEKHRYQPHFKRAEKGRRDRGGSGPGPHGPRREERRGRGVRRL